MRCGAGGIHVGRVTLHLLEHTLVLLVRLHGGHAEGNDLKTAQVAPLGREDFVENIRQLRGVAGQRRIADTHLGNAGKRRLQRGQKLAFQLAFDAVARVAMGVIAANVRVEQDGVRHAEAVFDEAADGDVHIDAGALIDHAEGHGVGCAVFVAEQLLGVEEIHALIHGRLAAESEALANIGKHAADAFAQIAREDGRFGGDVVCIFARLGADVYHRSLLHDHHALAIGHRDHGAIGYDIIRAVVAAASGGAFAPFHAYHVFRQSIAVEILFPLVSQNAAYRAECRFDKSHGQNSFAIVFAADTAARRSRRGRMRSADGFVFRCMGRVACEKIAE